MNIHSFELENFLLRSSIDDGEVDLAIKYMENIINSPLDQEVTENYASSLSSFESAYPELLKSDKKYRDALLVYSKILNYSQDSSIYLDIAYCFSQMNKFDLALAYCLRSEQSARFYHVFADACYRQGDYTKAVENMKKSIDLDPSLDKTFALSTYLIANKDPEGWKLIRSRFYKETNPTKNLIVELNKPLFSPDEKKGSILVCHEQGFGDMLMFSRFLKHLEPYATEIYFYVRPELKELFSSSFNSVKVVTSLEGIDPDYCVHLLDIPGILNIPVEDFIEDSYLSVRDSISLGSTSKKKIGIAWQGAISGDRSRDLEISDFESLLKESDFQLYSFQKGAGLAQCKSLFSDLNIIDVGSSSEDFYSTACMMKNLDCFVTTDNCLAHLAGALGIRTYLLLSEVPEYRWMGCKDTTEWYSSIKVIGTTWKDCVEKVKNLIFCSQENEVCEAIKS